MLLPRRLVPVLCGVLGLVAALGLAGVVRPTEPAHAALSGGWPQPRDHRYDGGYGGGPAAWARIGRDALEPGAPYRGDFPDPTVLRDHGGYYAYATTIWRLNLPVLRSADLRTWSAADDLPGTASPDALPQVPAWAAGRSTTDGRTVAMTWAPSVARVDGRYVAAYTVQVRDTGRMCLSVAVSDAPTGPFVDTSTRPLVCPSNRGAIDPQVRVEDGRVWLLYKTEDLAIGRSTRLWVREMAPDGLSLLPGARPRLLLRARANWERRTIEGPAMIRYRGRHLLFYSAGGWANPHYAIGVAVCAGVTGPCHRVADPVRRVRHRHHHRRHRPHRTYGPLLHSGGGIVAPGGGTPFRDDRGRLRLVYHAWDAGRVGYDRTGACEQSAAGCPQRRMHVATLALRRGRLVVTSLGLG